MESSHWSEQRLGDLLNLEYGMGLPAESRSGDIFPVFGSGGIVGHHWKPAVQGPGIIIGRKGSTGVVFWSEESFWPIDTTYFVVPKTEVDFRWLFWLCQWLPLNRLESSTGVPGLSRNDVYSVVIKVPPVHEQRRIAEILDTVDDAIQQTEALIAKLKQVKAGLLRDLLAHGAKNSSSRKRGKDQAEGLHFHPTLGTLPTDWQVVPLGRIASLITSGSRGWAAYYADKGDKFLRIGNLTRDHINLRLTDMIYVNPPPGGESIRTRAEFGDILISITADLGMIGVVPEGLSVAYVNQHIALVRLGCLDVSSRWVGTWLSSYLGQRQFQRVNDSGAKAGLNLKSIASLLIPIPPQQEQIRIVKGNVPGSV